MRIVRERVRERYVSKSKRINVEDPMLANVMATCWGASIWGKHCNHELWGDEEGQSLERKPSSCTVSVCRVGIHCGIVQSGEITGRRWRCVSVVWRVCVHSPSAKPKQSACIVARLSGRGII